MRELTEQEIMDVSGGRNWFEAWCDFLIYAFKMMPGSGGPGSFEGNEGGGVIPGL